MLLKIGITEWEQLSVNTQAEIARTVLHSETQFWIAENSADLNIINSLFQNPHLSRSILCKVVAIKHNKAKSLNTSKEELDILANDKNADIRLEVALNPNTSYETRLKLSKDEDQLVKHWANQTLSVSYK